MIIISVYFDRFKYPNVRINPSFGLLSNSQSNLSNSQSNPEIVLATDYVAGHSRNGRPDNAFFIEPHVEKREEKHEETRDKIKSHHHNVLGVFKKWSTIQLSLVKTMPGLYGACFPLYTKVACSLQQYDIYSEGILHLPSYVKSYKIVLKIIYLENEHNHATCQFMTAKEQEIKDAIASNRNISIPESKSGDDMWN